MDRIAFFALAAMTIVSAIVVIRHRNPVVSAIALAFNLVSIAGFFLLVDAQFLALLQVIVYAGAIMVLIVFVIMLLNLREELKARSAGTFQRWLAPLSAAAFAAIVIRAIWVAGPPAFGEEPAAYGYASTVGQTLFSTFYFPFEAISLLLVAAMVGAVVLAKRKL